VNVGEAQSPGRKSKARSMQARLAAVGVVALIAPCSVFASLPRSFAATFAPISGAGSTWSANAFSAWIANVAASGIRVNYAPVGSTSGRAEFADGTADWAASEIPYGVRDGNNFDPPPLRGFTYMPDTAGAVAFMYNLHIGGLRVTNLRLSGAVIAGIFTNKITMWNDPQVAADNPGLTLPAEPIVPVVRTDGSGSTWQFTQWLSATQGSDWTAYCAVVGRSPCTPTTAYPVQPGTAMVGQSGDLGVSGYVAQAAAEGAIGYTEYLYTQETGFPVAKVLNAAGYYTAPTPGHVGVSLLNAQIDNNPSDLLYQTADLTQVYADPDPRTYELSYYSYMILPTDASAPMTSDKGYTLGAFGQYLLCQGQQQVDSLGYAALPINLVEAGYAQLQRDPGASLPTSTSAFIASCNNPTFSADGTNTLANTDPMPPGCDKQGPTQCAAATSGAISTTTTMTASPSPGVTGQIVTLTATSVAADGSHPAGSVQFEVGGTLVGSPVAVNASGIATTTVLFGTAGSQSLSAVFTAANTTGYSSSTGTYNEVVQASVSAGVEPVGVTVPVSGSFTVTVETGTVNLTVSGSEAAGALNPITVTDTRNNYPGWSVSGQAADFTSSGTAAGSTMSGNQLGWAPTDTALATGVTLGGAVTPSAPGLGTTAAILASAPAGSGFGTSTLGANLTLVIPAAARPGDYASTLTVTAVTALP
jgi:phosphate ABC transporter phosphate-binding protein